MDGIETMVEVGATVGVEGVTDETKEDEVELATTVDEAEETVSATAEAELDPEVPKLLEAVVDSPLLIST